MCGAEWILLTDNEPKGCNFANYPYLKLKPNYNCKSNQHLFVNFTLFKSRKQQARQMFFEMIVWLYWTIYPLFDRRIQMLIKSSYCDIFESIISIPGLNTSAWKSSIRRFVITEKAPTKAFSWLKAATTAFTFKTLFRHYAKQTLC